MPRHTLQHYLRKTDSADVLAAHLLDRIADENTLNLITFLRFKLTTEVRELLPKGTSQWGSEVSPADILRTGCAVLQHEPQLLKAARGDARDRIQKIVSVLRRTVNEIPASPPPSNGGTDERRSKTKRKGGEKDKSVSEKRKATEDFDDPTEDDITQIAAEEFDIEDAGDIGTIAGYLDAAFLDEDKNEVGIDVDPVRRYLSQMGEIPLLGREKEIQVAQDIEELWGQALQAAFRQPKGRGDFRKECELVIDKENPGQKISQLLALSSTKSKDEEKGKSDYEGSRKKVLHTLRKIPVLDKKRGSHQ